MTNTPSNNLNIPRLAPKLALPKAWLFLLALLLPSLACAAIDEFSCAALPVSSNASHSVPAQALLRDPTGNLSVEDVTAPIRAADFVPFSGQLSAGYTHDALWLRFCLPPVAESMRPRWLRIAPPMLDELALYLPRNGEYTLLRTGDHHPFTERTWNYRLFSLPIAPETDISHPLYLRIYTSSAINMRLELHSEAEIQRLMVVDSMFYGVLGGSAALLIIFSLISWRWLREDLYLFYAINVFVGVFFVLMNAGFGSQFLYPESSVMNDHFIAWFTGPILTIHILFFTYLFALRRHLPWLYPYMLIMAGAYSLLTPLSFFTDWRNIGLFLQLQAFPVTLIWILLVPYLGWKDPERRIYIIAFVPWLLALLASAILRLGGISEHFLINYSGEIAALIHLFILPILIIQRTRNAELGKELALGRELLESQRVERELEDRVRHRTEELQHEITAREELQEQLKKTLSTERAILATQRQFVAMVSHEFRTPLAIIDTAAQRIDMMLSNTEPELMSRTRKIRRAVQRLLNLLENCLNSERLNSTNLKLQLTDLDLRDYLANDFIENKLTDTNRIHLVLPETAVLARCDRHLFEIVLSNLVNNALGYSPAESLVSIRLLAAESAGLAKGMLAIEVHNQGACIRPEIRERVFEKFFRSEDTQNIPGAGLGLHLAQELARSHGGDIVLAPSVPGSGTTFVLTLPVAQKA